MDSDERRNKIIVGVVIIVVTVAIVALILLKTSAAASCELSDVEPILQESYTNVSSADGKLLAHFDGYLKYHLNDSAIKNVFLPLELISVEGISGRASNEQTMVMNFNCAQLNMTFVTENKTFRATNVSVHLTTPNNKYHSCVVHENMDKMFIYSEYSHYRCQDFELVCELEHSPAPEPATTTTPSKPPGQTSRAQTAPTVADVIQIKLATLKIKKIEFELNGSVDSHKKSEFALPSQECATIIA